MADLDVTRPVTLEARKARRPIVGYFTLSAVLSTTVAAMLAVIFVWPFLCMVGQSFNRLDVLMNTLWLIPRKFSTKLYELMVTRYRFHEYIWNSALVAFTSTLLNAFASALAGYALAKCEFPGRDLLFLMILAIMLLPSQTMLVPRFVVMQDLKLVNNYWGLILPSVGGGAFGIFLMRQFMLQVPTEMLEAARIDGASELGLFTRVVVPTMLGPIMVLATLSLRGGWNALLWPQILITDETKMLLMPAIARLNNLTVADPYAGHVVVAAAITAAVVPLSLYAYGQRYFIAALAGAIKG